MRGQQLTSTHVPLCRAEVLAFVSRAHGLAVKHGIGGRLNDIAIDICYFALLDCSAPYVGRRVRAQCQRASRRWEWNCARCRRKRQRGLVERDCGQDNWKLGLLERKCRLPERERRLFERERRLLKRKRRLVEWEPR